MNFSSTFPGNQGPEHKKLLMQELWLGLKPARQPTTIYKYGKSPGLNLPFHLGKFLDGSCTTFALASDKFGGEWE
ncbi:hypothetical protein DSO57_1006177 [Entomophthora muscae]|uniref:Uncharacterized protein n=1 Tax=Entomophthora muscae TaxID=34485 RepID=A0ACC2RMJ2_9FUNG|nr:hypothetical protein DSO57_1006177 [Entomophthora muscae]